MAFARGQSAAVPRAVAARALAPPRPFSDPCGPRTGQHAVQSSRASGDAALRKEMGALVEENTQLRREVQEVRDCLAKLMVCSDATPTGGTAALPDASWLAAQLMQSHRQVQLLTEALVQRGELSTELEAALNKLRQPAADGRRSEYVEWATSTLRRLRHVQFVEELAAAHQPKSATAARQTARAPGRGIGSVPIDSFPG
mmetsp:Transcript_2574/g.5016  ORF Transcript_2574/g.5016 Transcript_2574/m.5016 type:complete len:200 (-) Transcript_2574:112-711(-)|eukprot:CAMPEP_0119073036 /NCGR_PEP_ID=MMETSP1178-20130426/61781_1 /TAXON_ID=33656 /ORGANISM="unid sp, Strain CCMP2000" /LENGTH=199 /DNA_ID=CAMNT_0007055095 /DNA_START=52 /DNA_END=651 /DNA_ORIENTATION=+